jgi:ribosomal protein S8|tara:strand:+ start:629 stop:1408 length:780 start_codon:yes stop_codon:yes gene_type:complete
MSNIEKVMNQEEPEIETENNESDSDESISTEELNKLQNEVNEILEEPEPKPEPEPEPEPEKPKIKKPTKKELLQQKKLLEQQLENIEDEPEEEPIKKVKSRGRPKLTEEQKKEKELSKKTIVKEKIIYMVKDENNEYKPIKNAKPLSKRHLQKIEEEKKIQEKEQEIGKRIVRTKKGKEDKRSTRERTPAQIAHSKKLVEMMAKRRAEKKKQDDKQQKDNIKQAVVEVVSKPIEEVKKELPNYVPPQKSINQQYNDFFG